jgi:hypothetical protein
MKNAKCKVQNGFAAPGLQLGERRLELSLMAVGDWFLSSVVQNSAKCKVQNGFAAPGHQLGERRLELSLMAFGG